MRHGPREKPWRVVLVLRVFLRERFGERLIEDFSAEICRGIINSCRVRGRVGPEYPLPVGVKLPKLVRYCASPTQVHCKTALGILGYVCRTSWISITFQRGVVSGLSVQVFQDADCTSMVTDRRSVSGGLVMCEGGCVSWCSRMQKYVTLSTKEAEYVAMADVLNEVIVSKAGLAFYVAGSR